MAENIINAGQQAGRKLTVVIGIVGVIAIIAIVVYLAVLTGPRADLRQCDEAIKTHLKAPATYRRIDGKLSPLSGLRIYDVTYDAENSFGVPLRSTSSCSVVDGHASVEGLDALSNPD